MTDKKLTALMPHRHHGSFFVKDCPHCAAGKRIAELQARLDAVKAEAHDLLGCYGHDREEYKIGQRLMKAIGGDDETHDL